MVIEPHTPGQGARRLGVAAISVAVLAVIAACSGDDTSSEQTPPLVPTTTSTPPTVPLASTTARASASTAEETSTTELNPVPTAPTISATATSSLTLPPVPTLVPQVASGLLTPEQLDPANVNNSRPIEPDHLAVIESYLTAIQVFSSVASQWPIDPMAPALLAAPLSPASLQRNQSALQDRLSRGEVLNVSQGVTFRPYVVGPVGDTAVVFDCEIAGHYWTNAANGELVPPDEIWPAGPGHVVQVGLLANLVWREGRWLVDTSQIHPAACG